MRDKLLAEWFWVDRWDGSSASLLPLEARGMYREMLSQAWRRGARLICDPFAIRRAIRCTDEEWERSWPLVKPYWREDGTGYLVNDTQVEIFQKTQSIRSARSRAGKAGNETRWGDRKVDRKADRNVVAEPVAEPVAKRSPPSPSPSLTETETETTDSRSAERAKSGSWTEQACDDWIERHGGTAPGGRIGRHLKTLVAKHGWPVVRAAWRAYLAEAEPQYATPDRFAATFGSWNRAPVATAPVPPPEVPERPSQEADAADFMQKVVLLLKETTPLQNWATWIRPIRGWAWLDSGSVLEIAAPSPEHAERLRGLYREKLRAAASQLGKTLKFKVFVLQWEPPALHNGSIR